MSDLKKGYQRNVDPFFVPTVAVMWTGGNASKEQVDRMEQRLLHDAFPDDVVDKAEKEAFAKILLAD